MSRLNSLSLAYPSGSEDAWVPPPIDSYVPRSPLGPPPGFNASVVVSEQLQPVRAPRRCSICRQTGHKRNTCPSASASTSVSAENTEVSLRSLDVRAPRRCSLCRQTGHNRNACPTASASATASATAVTVSNEDTLRQQLYCIVLSFLEFTFPGGSWRRTEEWFAFVIWLDSLTSVEVEDAILDPIPITRLVVRILYRNLRPTATNVPRSLLGKDYAKKISLVFDVSCEENVEKPECFICCDRLCSLNASCGHEFCVNCVNNIIDASKDKTSAPVCSFCRIPFASFTTSDHFTYTVLADLIKNI